MLHAVSRYKASCHETLLQTDFDLGNVALKEECLTWELAGGATKLSTSILCCGVVIWRRKETM